MKDFFDFIDEATSPIHTALACEKRLAEAGFEELHFNELWNVQASGRYYVKMYHSMIIAFTVASDISKVNAFKIIASHGDFPCFKIKPEPHMHSDNYLKLNTGIYGGPIYNTWLDRVLSIAGMVSLKSDNPLSPKMRYIDFKKPLMTIPNLAIHFNRKVNEGVPLNPQVDLLPIIGLSSQDKENFFIKLLANELNVVEDEILDFDLFAYLFESGTTMGMDGCLISAPRLDNLAMVYASFDALIDSKQTKDINIAVCFDNEEVGSTTNRGANNNLLSIILEKICMSMNRTKEQYVSVLSNSFAISADASHAVHPNLADKADPTHKSLMNQGIAIKYNANMSYASDSESAGVIIQLCKALGIPYQKYTTRSDNPGGKTLGPLMNTFLPIRTVDVGLPMAAMHSARELIGKQDFLDSLNLFKFFYEQ